MKNTTINIFRNSHVEGQMGTIGIVVVNSLGRCNSNLGMIGKTSIQAIFVLESADRIRCEFSR